VPKDVRWVIYLQTFIFFLLIFVFPYFSDFSSFTIIFAKKEHVDLFLAPREAQWVFFCKIPYLPTFFARKNPPSFSSSQEKLNKFLFATIIPFFFL
jgi:hypothetical protein